MDNTEKTDKVSFELNLNFFFFFGNSTFELIAMKIFQLICIQSTPLGIDGVFNPKTVVAFLFLAYYAVSSCAYFVLKSDKKFSEFILSVYVSVSTVAYVAYFITIVWKKPNILKFMADLENLIEKRKFLTLFKSILN